MQRYMVLAGKNNEMKEGISNFIFSTNHFKEIAFKWLDSDNCTDYYDWAQVVDLKKNRVKSYIVQTKNQLVKTHKGWLIRNQLVKTHKGWLTVADSNMDYNGVECFNDRCTKCGKCDN